MSVRSVGVGVVLAGVLVGGTGWAVRAAAQTPAVAPPPPPAASPGLVDWPDMAAPSAAPGTATPAAEGDVRYTVEVTGLDDLRLDRAFRADSALYKGRGAVANLAQINRRIVEDRDLIDLLLRSVGHYGGKTAVTVQPGPPATVRLTVDPGPVYTVASIDVVVPDGRPVGLVRAGLGIKAGDPLVAERVEAGQDGLKAYLAAHGHPFATIAPPAITVDHEMRTAALTQHVDPGPTGVFGRARIVGTSIIPQRELDRMVRFRPGEPYDASQLDDLRRALVATTLVGSVSLKPVSAGPLPNGTEAIDVEVRTETAPLRTIAATAGYSTSQGIRTEASFQHRNLIPPNGAVTFRVVGAEREQLVGVELRRMNWHARDLTLTLGASFDTATQDAFNARTLSFYGNISRETNLIWQKKWYFTVGGETDISTERDKSAAGEPERTYYIAAVPASLTYDDSDNLLDPRHGFRLTGRVSPELSFNGDIFGYLKVQLEGTKYLPLTDTITLAARGHAGTILGAAQRDIAPTRRFYAGGGGSVRGYGYQDVGPKAADGTPTGGDSIVEASVEARVRLGTFGIVPFFDAGEVDTDLIPRFRNVQYGAGLGLRYYTSFGPVRIDVATPINPTPNDARVQFYVSIGQAF